MDKKRQGQRPAATTTPLRSVLAEKKQLGTLEIPSTPSKMTPSSSKRTGGHASGPHATIRTPGFRVTTPGKRIVPKTNPKLKSLASKDPTTKLNVSILQEQIQLKNDVVLFEEELADQCSDNENLREKLKLKEALLKKVEAEKLDLEDKLGTIMIQVKFSEDILEDEKEKLKYDLESLEKKTLNDKKKLSDLSAELVLKKTMIGIKGDEIEELKSTIEILRGEIIALKEENAKKALSVASNSKNCRGSISSFQSKFAKNLQEVEEKYFHAQSQHKAQIEEIQNKHTEEVQGLKLLLQSKNADLEECKKSLRESSANLINDKNQNLIIGELKSELQKMSLRMNQLEVENNQLENASVEAEVLKGQLDQVLKMNEELSNKLTKEKQKLQQSEEETKNLSNTNEKLQMSVKELKQEKEEILSKKTPANVEDSSIDLAQNQELITRFEKAKDLAAEFETRNNDLEEQLKGLKKEFGLTKVDIRILRREKLKLEETVATTIKKNEELSNKQKAAQEISKKTDKLESEIKDLKGTLEKNDVVIRRTTEKNNELKALNESLKNQISFHTSELRKKEEEVNRLTSSLQETETKLVKTQSSLNESNERIETQKMSNALIKEAASVLDKQLQDFETAYVARTSELKNLQTLMLEKDVEISSLKDSLIKANIKANEERGLKIFYKGQHNSTVEELNSVKGTSSKEFEDIKKKLQENQDKNKSLATKIADLVTENQKTKIESCKLQASLRSAELKNDLSTKELEALGEKIKNLKKELDLLTSSLEQAVDKSEDHKNRYEALASQHEVQEQERAESTVQLKSTIRQQGKLIQYLQQQNEILLKKQKDRKFSLFGKLKEDIWLSSNEKNNDAKEEDPCPELFEPGRSLTPVHLIREHFAVQRLEETAESLKKKLAEMQKCKTSDLVLPTVPIEECILLKENNS